MKYIQAKREEFRTVFKGQQTDLYYLKNGSGIEMSVSNFGARLIELWLPDREGRFADVVLGHYHIDEYIHFQGERFLGAAIGRFGNRIAKGRFELDGRSYQLPQNEGSNSLHGGFEGFDRVVWQTVQLSDTEIRFSYFSPDGEAGYPGNLQVTMTYELSDKNEFRISYRAVSDQQTIVNLTHHSFFNLRGEGNGTVNDHLLTIHADRYTPIDQLLIPTGELAAVEGTPMDFRRPVAIGKRLDQDFPQLRLGKGYDHNWVLNRNPGAQAALAASVLEPQSGRYMEVFTDQPGIQFYGGNFFDGKTPGKSGRPYLYRESFALETQFFPDSPNQPAFPNAVLKPGSVYEHTCIYKFSIQ